MAEVVVQRGRADAQAFGGARDDGQRRQRRQLVEQVVWDDQRAVAEGFDMPSVFGKRRPVDDVAGRGEGTGTISRADGIGRRRSGKRTSEHPLVGATTHQSRLRGISSALPSKPLLIVERRKCPPASAALA